MSSDNFSFGVKARAFGLTWLSYATYYLTRKNFSIVKATLHTTMGVSTWTLSLIDSLYSTAYAAGQPTSGFLADRIGPKRVLTFGMIATAGLSVWFGFSSLPAMFLLAWTLNGLAQSTGWSPNVKGMTPFFSRLGRGTVMGAWTTCYIVGSFVANPVAQFFKSRFDWRASMWGPAAFTVAVALAVLLFLPTARVPVDDEERRQLAEERRTARRELLRQPLLYALGFSYFFMKLTRYVLWFWLPFFMETELHYSPWWSAMAPLFFEFGGFVGALSIGWISDRFLQGRRVPAATVGLLLLAGALVAYGRAAPLGLLPSVTALFFVGFFLFGPDAIVSATAAQDLGGPAAAGAAAGIINGIGSTGQIFSGVLIPLVTSKGDWSGLWSTLAGGAVVGMVILVPFWKSRR